MPNITSISAMFMNCVLFNQTVNIPNSVKYCNSVFKDCYSLNQPVTMPDSIKYCSRAFRNCTHYNMPTHISNNVIECGEMFSGCTNFNQPLNLVDGANYSNMLCNCKVFNQTIAMGNNGNYSNMLLGCNNFNQPLNLGDNSIYNDFLRDLSEYNQPVVFGNNGRYSNAFLNCSNFNQPVLINKGLSFDNMFRNCSSFNQTVLVPTNTNTTNMFRDCISLNQPISIVNNKYPGANMLYGCTNYNQPMSTLLGNNDYAPTNFSYLYSFTAFNYPVNVSNLNNKKGEWFRNMIGFNQPITLSEDYTNYYASFENCYEFNQPVTIPENAINVVNTFVNCRNFNQPIFIPESLLLKWDANNEYQTRTSLGWNGGLFKGCLEFNQQINFGGNYDNGHYYGYITNTTYNMYTFDFDCFYNWYNDTGYNYPISTEFLALKRPTGHNFATFNESFKYFNKLNQPLTFPTNSTLINTFWGRNQYTRTIDINDESEIRSAFVGCENFEKLRIGNDCNVYHTFCHFNAIERTWYGLNNCNFNGIVEIGDNVKGDYLLAHSKFNQDFTYKSSWNIAEALFSGTPFNSNLYIENGCTEFSMLLYAAFEFNKPFNLPNSTINARGLLYGCNKFNQPIDIPESVVSLESAFCLCVKFNQIVNLPENARLDGAFAGCSNYNSPIYLPYGSSCEDILEDCVNFNAEITINNDVGGAYNAPGIDYGFLGGAFNGCTKLNQTIRIPYSSYGFGSLRDTFRNCISQNSPIYVPVYYRNNYNSYLNNRDSQDAAIISGWSEQAYSCIVWY